jgi:allophanate hydrolase subunit 2
MGYRLAGAALPVKTASIASHGVVAGALQVPPDGAPILLMADAQTTGGYPIVAVVVGADLPLVAQLLPGDRLRFRRTTAARAVAAWRALDAHARSRIPEESTLAALGLAGAGPVGPFG